MPADVETMFYVREKPWHGLGTVVMEAPTSAEALRLAGLDWKVVQEPVYTGYNEMVSGSWQGSRGNISSPGSGSAPIWCSATPMTVPAP